MTPENSEYIWPVDRIWQDSQTSMPTDIFRNFFIFDRFQTPLTDTSLQIFHFSHVNVLPQAMRHAPKAKDDSLASFLYC